MTKCARVCIGLVIFCVLCPRGLLVVLYVQTRCLCCARTRHPYKRVGIMCQVSRGTYYLVAKFQGLLTGGFCGGVATLRPCPPSLCSAYEGACAPCRLRVIGESSNFVKHNKKKVDASTWCGKSMRIRMDFPHHVEASTFFLLCFTKLLDSPITRKRHGAQAPSYALHKLGGQGRNVATPPQNPPVSKP